jgi:hypothetical protein
MSDAWEWADPEYRLTVERDGERFRGRLVHVETKHRINIVGRFETQAALHRAAQLRLAELRLVTPPLPAPLVVEPPDDAYTEYAVWHIGDWHIGKRETDEASFRARAQRVGERMIDLRERALRSYAIPGMLIAMTGDMCDGANIYPTQTYEQAMPNARDQALLGGVVLAELFDNLRPYYGDIRVAVVAGNHGMIKYAPDSQNHDVVLADELSQRLAGKIPVIYRAHDPWLLRVEVVAGLHALLYHGHKKLGKTRTTAEKDIARWATINQFAPFHYVLCGHYHYREYWEFNNIHFSRTGTMLSDDPYSRELGYESSVAATLFGVNIAKPDTRRVTFNYPVDLR